MINDFLGLISTKYLKLDETNVMEQMNLTFKQINSQIKHIGRIVKNTEDLTESQTLFDNSYQERLQLYQNLQNTIWIQLKKVVQDKFEINNAPLKNRLKSFLLILRKVVKEMKNQNWILPQYKLSDDQ